MTFNYTILVTVFFVFLVPSRLFSASSTVVFSDGFENGMSNWTQFWPGSNNMNTVAQDPEGDAFYPHGGSKMANANGVNNYQKTVMQHVLDANYTGTVTFWVSWNFRVDYGTTAATKQAYVEVIGDDGFALFINMRNNTNGRNNYLGYRVFDNNGDTHAVVTNIAIVRDRWYEAKFIFDGLGIKGYWDGQLIFSNQPSGGFNTFNGIDFGTNDAIDPRSSAYVDAMFVDDVTVIQTCDDVWNAGEGLPGDIDRSCTVDWNDLAILMSEWLYEEN